MSSQNFIKNITSKDIKLSNQTIQNLIKNANVEEYRLLCEKADFIFPFLKQRISDDFIKLVEIEDIKALFEFSKIYVSDFENLIVDSLLKFASEDLTDEILEILENGTNEQKAYLVKYFLKIKDPIALEYINKCCESDFEPLKSNCAVVLAGFQDETKLNQMKEVVSNSSDEFEKLNAYNFILNYGGEKQISFVFENCFDSPFLVNILSTTLDNNELNYLKNFLNNETLIKIFQTIIEAYPECLSLDSAYYWNMVDFIKYIYEIKNEYAQNILLYAKARFNEFTENDIYTFDFDKNVKNEIKNISNYLNTLELKFDFKFENNYEFRASLNVIREFKLDYASDIAQLINKQELNDEQIALCATVLKDLNKTDLIDKQILNNLENKNIKALIESYVN